MNRLDQVLFPQLLNIYLHIVVHTYGSGSNSGGCWAPEPVQRQDKALNSSHSGLGLQDAVAA